MTELVRQLAELWAGHGAWALVTAIVSIVVATLISKYLDQRWKHAYDREMERFKTELGQDRLAINAALASLNAASAASHPKTLEGVELLWRAILALKDGFPGVSLYAEILTKEEWCRLPANPDSREKLGDISDMAILGFMKQQLAKAEHARPFVGELIWSMYFVYRAFVMRVVAMVEHEFDKGELTYWYEDRGIQQFLQLLLTPEEIRLVERYQAGRYNQARELMEGKILAEMNRVIAGHRSADNGLEKARKMLGTVAAVQQGST